MQGAGSRQAAAALELAEWREDVTAGGIGSHVVLVGVSRGWGRSALLDHLAAEADKAGPVTLVARVRGDLPPGGAVQAQSVAAALALAWQEPSAARHAVKLLDLDTAEGKAQLGLGVAGLFIPGGLAVQVGLLVASLGLTAAGNLQGSSPAGERGVVARAARRLARLSVAVPVVAVVDDADCLDPGLALALVRGLAGRADGQVLVVIAAAPGSDLAAALTRDPGPDLVGRVNRVDADPAMGYADRVALAAELLPGMPPAVLERVARRTATFGEVRAVSAAGRVTELPHDAAAVEGVAAVDAAADVVLLGRGGPSALAVALAWAGGALHVRQAAHAARVLGGSMDDGDPRVAVAERVARLAGPADGLLRLEVAGLSAAVRGQMASVVLTEADDPQAGTVERIIAWQAAHRVRGDLPNPAGLAVVQAALVCGLEELGDLVAAHGVAAAALAELDAGSAAPDDAAAHQQLLAAVLRLARAADGTAEDDPVAGEAVRLALSGGAATSLEARLWAAVDLLRRPGRRQDGLALARQVTASLEEGAAVGELVGRWRMLLAFHAGQAGDTGLAQELLSPLFRSDPDTARDAAAIVLRATAGLQAGTRLQVILLQAELDATPAADDQELLRLHAAIATDHATLGEYPQALRHGLCELPLRQRISGPNHPATLATRSKIAVWTGYCGDPAGALALLRELLPDQARLMGPDHPGTLSTRGNIAYWTEECGYPAAALTLSLEVLSDQARVLGPDHPETLGTRGNIAFWTGECGDRPRALALFRELLPDLTRVLGPDHRDTMIARNNVAFWTGECGDRAEALALFRELLPDRARVLGPDHPDALTTRSNVAFWTGECGDPAEALALFRELLPDRVRASGPDHPDTLTARCNIAFWTGECGDRPRALALFQELLPDQARVLGPGHPSTLLTRDWIKSLEMRK